MEASIGVVGTAPVSSTRRWTLTLPQLWAFLAVAGLLVILNLTLVRPHDFWWHVRAGQWIVANRHVPDIDLFSYTRVGEPFAYQMWLAEVVLFLLFRSGGLPLIIFLHAAVIAGAYGILLLVNRQAAGRNLRWAALATLAGAALGLDNWNVRPQTASFLLFAVVLWLLEGGAARSGEGYERYRRNGALWVLPPLFALWANLHGGFVFGLVLLGTYLLAEAWIWLRHRTVVGGRRRFPGQLFAIAALSVMATLLTPTGLGVAGYLLGFVRHPITQSLNVEFLPPTIRTLGGRLFFASVAVLVLLLVQSRYRPAPRETSRLLVFGLLALMAERSVAWFGFVVAPVMAASLHQWLGSPRVAANLRPGRERLNWTLASVVGLLVFLSLPWFRPYLPLPAERQAYVSTETPVQAVAFLQTLAQPVRAYHTEAAGSYLTWADPEVPVFIDTRFELYPPSQWQDAVALNLARYDWETILARYGVNILLLDRRLQEPLVRAAAAATHWEQLYADEQAVIFRFIESDNQRAAP